MKNLYMHKEDTRKLNTREFNILLTKAKNGCKKSMNRIVLSFMPYVIKKVHKDST